MIRGGLTSWPPKLAKSCLNDAPQAPQLAKNDLKDAPQRRGYTRSLPMGLIDGTYRCATQETQESIKMQEILPYRPGMTHRGCHVWSILEHFWSILGKKTTKIAPKDAPQRRVYARSLQNGPIDVSTGEAVRPCARLKDAYFWTASLRFRSGVRLTLVLFIYQ
eukprot:gene24428-biopygen23897